LATFSQSLISPKQLTKLIHEWAKETISDDDGGAIRSVEKEKGAFFTFSASPGSHLHISASTESESDSYVSLLSNLTLSSTSPQSRSLIEFSSQNLIDSAVTYVGEKLYAHPPGFLSSDSDSDLDTLTATSGSIDAEIATEVPKAPETSTVIFEWPSASAENREVVLRYLTSWTSKYSSRGIGISAVAVDGGSAVSFVSRFSSCYTCLRGIVILSPPSNP
jgi:hypothetical protein